MINKIVSIGIGLAVAACSVFKAEANLPTYKTLSAFGNGTSPATLVFPADPNSQIRLVSLFYSSDTNNAMLNLSSGTTAYYLTWTNLATTTVTNIINSTNGLAAGGILVLQSGGTCYTNDVVSVGNTGTNTMANFGVAVSNLVTTIGATGTGPVGTLATNVNFVVIQSGGWGVIPAPYADLYLMSAVSAINVGSGTNAINGDDIFSAAYARPLLVQLAPASSTNRLSSVSAHYDSQGQN